MKSVCIFNGDMSRGGGTERVTQLLAHSLLKAGRYEVWVLNLNNKTNSSFYPLDKNARFFTLPPGGLVKKALSLLSFVRKNKIDALINVDVMLGLFSLPISLLRPKTRLVFWEMFNIRNDIGSKNTSKIRSLALKKGAYYVTQTRGDMEAFMREMPVKCPITHIYNPCPVDEGYSGYAEDSHVIITAGHFFFTKGYDLAVEAARLVFVRHPDWRWEFWGDGVNMEKIREKVFEYGLENNVLLCGRAADMTPVYKRAAMYVMTSRTEGFGLVLTEAKAHNLPTIAYDVDFGPREIIEDGVSGFLIEAFNTEKMAGAICELIEDRRKRLSFSEHARDNLDKFSTDAFAEKWTGVIDAVQEAR